MTNHPSHRSPLTIEEAALAASRFVRGTDGTPQVIRFSTGQVLEHALLTLAFLMLALTGLAQTYHNTALGGAVIAFFGSVDAMRQVHHSWAWILGLLSVYHVLRNLFKTGIARRVASIWLSADDGQNLRQWVRFALGFSRETPRFGRFTPAEKITYWLTVILLLGLGGSGLGQGASSWWVRVLPAWAIPLAHIVHRSLAIAAVWLLLLWHGYDVLFRRRNGSMFTGQLSLADMEQDHPAELEYLRLASSLVAQTPEKEPAEMAESLTGSAEEKENVTRQEPAQVPEGESAENHPQEETIQHSMAEDIQS